MSDQVERVARAIHENGLKFSLPREGIRPATFEEVWNATGGTRQTLEAQARAAIAAMSSTREKALEEAVVAAAWEVVAHPQYMTLEECERYGQTPGPGNRLRSALEALAALGEKTTEEKA